MKLAESQASPLLLLPHEVRGVGAATSPSAPARGARGKARSAPRSGSPESGQGRDAAPAAEGRTAPAGPEPELHEIIRVFNVVTERLKASHERLTREVRRLHAQLDEKNRELARRERLAALGEMAAGVAHEIRNPLAGIRLYASTLERDVSDRPDLVFVTRKIESGIMALDAIVGDILLFAGNAEPRPQRVQLASVLDDVVALAAPRCRAAGASLVIDGAAKEIELHGDPTQLTRALLNLVLNALDAAGPQGRVHIGTCAPDRAGAADEVLTGIVVEDNGAGIPDDLLDRIFNPFFTTKHAGTGLGLAIVHRIAEAHGGWVMAANRPEGGARLTLFVPLARS